MALHTSRSFSRPLRVLSLTVNVLLMLFIEALTYDLADPDDGTCEKHETKYDCLNDMSSLATEESKCYWVNSNSSCHFRDIDGEFYRIAIVCVIVAVMGTPLALAMEYLISNVLSADTRTASHAFVRVAPAGGLTALQRGQHREFPQSSTIFGSKGVRKSVMMLGRAESVLGTSCEDDYRALQSDLTGYRTTLSIDDAAEFDSK